MRNATLCKSFSYRGPLVFHIYATPGSIINLLKSTKNDINPNRPHQTTGFSRSFWLSLIPGCFLAHFQGSCDLEVNGDAASGWSTKSMVPMAVRYLSIVLDIGTGLDLKIWEEKQIHYGSSWLSLLTWQFWRYTGIPPWSDLLHDVCSHPDICSLYGNPHLFDYFSRIFVAETNNFSVGGSRSSNISWWRLKPSLKFLMPIHSAQQLILGSMEWASGRIDCRNFGPAMWSRRILHLCLRHGKSQDIAIFYTLMALMRGRSTNTCHKITQFCR